MQSVILLLSDVLCVIKLSSLCQIIFRKVAGMGITVVYLESEDLT